MRRGGSSQSSPMSMKNLNDRSGAASGAARAGADATKPRLSSGAWNEFNAWSKRRAHPRV